MPGTGRNANRGRNAFRRSSGTARGGPQPGRSQVSRSLEASRTQVFAPAVAQVSVNEWPPGSVSGTAGAAGKANARKLPAIGALSLVGTEPPGNCQATEKQSASQSCLCPGGGLPGSSEGLGVRGICRLVVQFMLGECRGARASADRQARHPRFDFNQAGCGKTRDWSCAAGHE